MGFNAAQSVGFLGVLISCNHFFSHILCFASLGVLFRFLRFTMPGYVLVLSYC